jgi:protein-S-isoprenylcysteine O-methyltransferase Ste14
MSNKMTAWGIGPRLAFISLAYFALAAIIHISNPGLFVMTQTPHIVFPIVGTTLIVIGLVLWASAVREIDRAFCEGRLLTKGAYAIVRNPMYSGFIVFVAPGIALWLRSWPLLTVPLVTGMLFKLL